MTIREAITGEIEPYGLSEDSVEKSFLDANGRYGTNAAASVEDDYSYALKKVVAYAALLCLNRVRMLAAENIGGLSQQYDVRRIEKRMEALATEAGIPVELLLAGSGDTITCNAIW